MISPEPSKKPVPRVTLVGAGPGDPELMTVKAVRVLESADAVLFDALVSQQVLSLAPAGIPMRSVGKRAGAHSFSQEEINSLIVEYACLYGHVVRLKGGDPFVFGRGAEEVDFVRAHHIPVEVVPGISSAIAVPAALGIPVTARGICESFWVVTATTRNGNISADVALAARSSATVVILMGLHKLHEIMDHFAVCGRAETPVAVIQNGTTAGQRVVIGNVLTITDMVRQAGIAAPALIVVGDVVKRAHTITEIAEIVGLQYQ
jgi:uroporphyrin-III C-methyltransferase